MKNPVVFASTWITPEAHYRLPLRILPEKNPTSLMTLISHFSEAIIGLLAFTKQIAMSKSSQCVLELKKMCIFSFFFSFFFADLKHCADHLPRWRTGESAIGENYYFSDPN